MTIQMKPLQQYFHSVLLILLVVRTFQLYGRNSVAYSTLLFYYQFYYIERGSFNLRGWR